MNEIEILQNLVEELSNTRLTEGQISLWQPIQQQSNRIYRIQFNDVQWIAKVFLKPAEFDDAPRREYDTMQLLLPLDIAPRPIHYEEHNGNQHPIVIYEFMQGDMWNRTTPTRANLQQLADLWIQMNQVSVENLWLSRGMERTGEQIAEEFVARFQNYADWTEIHFPEGRRAAMYLQDIAKKRLILFNDLFALEPPLCFSRADPRFANIIQRPNNCLGMIDWEDSGLRDVARDIADIIVHPNQEDLVSWEDWQAFLQPYFAERRKVDVDIERRVHLYQGVFPLFWLSGLVTYGIRQWKSNHDLSRWNVNTMNPNHRLRRYLARAMAYPKMDFEDELKEIEGLQFFDLE